MRNQFGKRMFCLLLTLVLLAGLFPAPVRAAEDGSETEVSGAPTLVADNSFGRLLADGINQELATQEEGHYDAGITELTVSGRTASVCLHTPVDANLVVAIYDEDSGQMLGSGTLAVTAGQTAADVTIEIEQMPDYFRAKAFLLHAEINSPVSEEYTTDKYTKALQEIKEAKVSDFDPEQVLNLDGNGDTNFAVVSTGTLLAREGEDCNQVTDNGNGTYHVDHPDDRFRAMRPGDIFVYEQRNGMMLIVSVAKVSVQADALIVTDDPDADVSKAFQFIKIEVDNSSPAATADELSPNGDGDDDPFPEEFPFELPETTLGNAGGFEITVSGSGSLTVDVDFNYYFVADHHVSAFLKSELTLDGEVTLTGQTTEKMAVKLFPKPLEVPFLGGTLRFQYEPELVVSATCTVTAKINYSQWCSVSYDGASGRISFNKGEPENNNEIRFEGKLYVGLAGSFSLVALSESVVKITGTLEVGLAVTSTSVQYPTPNSYSVKVHDCDQCCELQFTLEISVAPKIEIFKHDVLEHSFDSTDNAFSASVPLLDCYYSETFREFGKGKCPHIGYRIDLFAHTQLGSPRPFAKIAITKDYKPVNEVMLVQDQQVVTGSIPETDREGTALFYLPEGEYSITVSKKFSSARTDISVADSKVEADLVFHQTVNSDALNLSRSTVCFTKPWKNTGTPLKAFLGEKEVDCQWTSSNSDVAIVGIDGTLMPQGAGDATITAVYEVDEDTAYTAQCHVTVLDGEIEAFGECGEEILWFLESVQNGYDLTVIGTGDMSTYDYSLGIDPPWSDYADQIQSVYVKPGVTSVGNCAFSGMDSLELVRLPETLKKIGAYGFAKCAKLDSLELPEGVETIGGNAFRDSQLSMIRIPSTVTKIFTDAFRGCENLSAVHVCDMAKWCQIVFGNSACNPLSNGATLYLNDQAVTDVHISVSVDAVGEYAFYNYDQLTSIRFDGGVPAIGKYAFQNCTGLEHVTLAGDTKSIGESAFNGCTSLTVVDNLAGLQTVGKFAFLGCAKLSKAQLPDTVTSIGYQAFSGTVLTEVTIPGKAVIGLRAFEACPALKTVTIGEGVKEIPQQAFQDCGKLTTLTLPTTLTKIDANAFKDCASLAAVDIPGSVQTIADAAFQDCGGMKTATIGAGVESIGNGTFRGCAGLKTLVIPESVTSIGSSAFKNCTGLTSITLPSQLKQVLISTFSGCGQLTQITIPQGVTQIGASAFYGCTRLKNVTIPDSVINIATTAFSPKTVTAVTYGGTCAQWGELSGHNNLKDAVVTCSDGVYTEPLEEVSDPNPEIVDEEPTEPTETPTTDPTESVTEPTKPVTESTEPPVEEEVEEPPLLEEVADIQWYAAPAGAKMTVEPVLQKLSAFTGTESGKNGVRSVKFTGLEPGEEYVLIVSLIPGSLVPQNLLYIDQDNAASDGTLSFTYIPRQDVPAQVQLYGVPAGRTVTLDREHLTMKVGSADQKITAAVTPGEWAGDLKWSAENPENTEVISVSPYGDVTPKAPGTAYAVATVTHGQYKFSARCRVDVTEAAPKEAVRGVQLGTKALTTELLRRDYASFDVILLLEQNQNPPEAIAAEGAAKGNGVAITSAAFADKKTADVFDLLVKDDRTLLVVPKDSAVKNPKPVAGKYFSKVIVNVGGKEFVTDASLTLTVKKSTPKLKAAALTFNPFYTGQSQAIPITGATVTGIESKSRPEWLTLENGVLKLAKNAPAKASGKVTVRVKTAEWAIPTDLTLSVKTAYAAPKLKLSASSATFAAGDAYKSSQGVMLKLLCGNKNDTLKDLNVSGVNAPEGFEILQFDRTDGSFILKPTKAVTAGTKEITVSFSGTGAKVTLKPKISTKAVSITAKPSTVTLNSVVGDSAAIPLTASPADYKISDVNIRLADSRGGAIAQDLLTCKYSNGLVIVRTVEGKTQPNTTYQLYVSTKDTAKETVLTVKTLADTEKSKPTVSAKVTGGIDLSFPESCAVVTPVFKNYASGAVKTVNCTVTESQGKTPIGDATAKFRFTLIPEKNLLQLSAKDGLVPGNTYLLSLTYKLADDSTCSCTAKITVKRTPVKLKLSKNSLSLNKAIGDTAVVDVTSQTKDYDLTKPVAMLIPPAEKDGQEINLSQPGEQSPLTITWSDGKLMVTANATAEAGKAYKIVLRATEDDPAVTLTVKILDTPVTASLKAGGAIDVVRNSTAITVTPSYKNYMGLVDIHPQLTIESGNGRIYQPVEAGLFNIVQNGNGTSTITKAPGAKVDTTLKYRAKLTCDNCAKPAYVNLSIKSGTAKFTVTGTPVLYKADRYSRGTFRIATTDPTLNAIDHVAFKTPAHADLFQLYDYGSGEFALGFKDNLIPAGTLPTSVTLNVFCAGNETNTPNAAVTVKLQLR